VGLQRWGGHHVACSDQYFIEQISGLQSPSRVNLQERTGKMSLFLIQLSFSLLIPKAILSGFYYTVFNSATSTIEMKLRMK
jgi:hypothetical protein